VHEYILGMKLSDEEILDTHNPFDDMMIIKFNIHLPSAINVMISQRGWFIIVSILRLGASVKSHGWHLDSYFLCLEWRTLNSIKKMYCMQYESVFNLLSSGKEVQRDGQLDEDVNLASSPARFYSISLMRKFSWNCNEIEMEFIINFSHFLTCNVHSVI